MVRVGIVRGTFTDVNAFDEDSGELVAIRKYLPHPAQPAAVMGNRGFGPRLWDQAVALICSSTAALNTMLQGKGARVGLLTCTASAMSMRSVGSGAARGGVQHLRPAPKMLTRDRAGSGSSWVHAAR
jgi:N-methylhydantoinase A/oxoprolinase/acetone carboxylase beta subunit